MLPAFFPPTQPRWRGDQDTPEEGSSMRHRGFSVLATACLTASAAIVACGGGSRTDNTANGDVATPAASAPATNAPADSAAVAEPQHHSKLAGAAVGAAAGHMLGGHAVAGAAVGALVQHERNKHARHY